MLGLLEFFLFLAKVMSTCCFTVPPNLSQEGLSNRINPLAKGVAPAIVLPPYYGRDTGIAKLGGAAPLKKGAAPVNLAIPVSRLFWRHGRCHTYFPVVQLIGLQYSVLATYDVWVCSRSRESCQGSVGSCPDIMQL